MANHFSFKADTVEGMHPQTISGQQECATEFPDDEEES